MDPLLKDLTPEEIKLTTIQFIGQNLSGALKELDSSIISKNQTLQGKTIDPVRVVQAIPQSRNSQPYASVVNAGMNIQPQQARIVHQQPAPIPVQHDPNQLEFDFDKKAKYSDILNALTEIKTILMRIDNKLSSND